MSRTTEPVDISFSGSGFKGVLISVSNTSSLNLILEIVLYADLLVLKDLEIVKYCELAMVLFPIILNMSKTKGVTGERRERKPDVTAQFSYCCQFLNAYC